MRLPIYQDYRPTPALVELTGPLDRDKWPAAGAKGRGCDRCALSGTQAANSRLRNPCIGAEGMPGGLLVVGGAPTKDDDTMGRPFQGTAGMMLRRAVKEYWQGPVAYDSALRCAPGRTPIKDKMVDACRGFLTQTIEEVSPTRILAVGAWAAIALFGRAVPPMTSRGAYAWLQGDKPIPVFFVLEPGMAARNRFHRQWFDADIKHALTSPDPPPAPWEAEATLVTNEKLALYAERKLLEGSWVSFDVETAGTMWNPDFRIISAALCGDLDDDAWVWPKETLVDLPTSVSAALRLGARVEGETFDAIARECGAPLAVLLRLLTSRKLRKVGQNVKYDQLAFRSRYGVTVRPIHIDTRLQRKLLEPEADGGLGKMAELVGMGGHKEEAQDAMKDLVSRIKKAFSARDTEKKPRNREEKIEALGLAPHIEAALRLGEDVERFMFELLPDETLYRYNARDAVVTKKLAVFMEAAIEREPQLHRMWKKQVLPAAVALERIEGWGVAASKNAIATFDRFLEHREQTTKAQLDAYGADINWDSRDQVAELLFRKLGLPVMKSTPTGKPSTDEESLDMIAKQTGHPVPAALVDYRFVTKLRGTYAQGMFPHVREDGRIHPNIKLDGARSGRTSCTDPNLQNIPRAQTPEGKMARDCFVAPPGYVLMEADYSQLELRVAAMLSGDKVMQEIFKSGVDYHLRTAQLVAQLAWGIRPEDVEDKHRSLAKSVNFGVLYGKTAATFAKEWGISKAKAQAIVDAIMGNFKDLQRWCSAREAEAAKTGYVWTWWAGEKARRRPLWQIADQDDVRASVARNGAKNTPIQGTASDFCIASLVQSVQWIEQDGIQDLVKLVLAVHDSLMFEVHESMVAETAATVNEIMLGHDSAGVELVADFKVGKSWGSMEKYKVAA